MVVVILVIQLLELIVQEIYNFILELVLVILALIPTGASRRVTPPISAEIETMLVGSRGLRVGSKSSITMSGSH